MAVVGSRAARGILGSSAAGLLLFVLIMGWSVQSSAQAPPKRVLLLHGYNFSHRASLVAGEAARNRLAERSAQRFVLDAEFLDLERPGEPDHAERQALYLKAKYAHNPPDIILAIGGVTLPFVIKYRDLIGPDIPIVFTSIELSTYEALGKPKGVTGIVLDLDRNLKNTIALAEGLQPTARHIYFIAGSGYLDRGWQARARRFAESHLARFETTFLFELTYDQVLAELAKIPPDSIVVMLTFYVDPLRKAVQPDKVAMAFANASPAPFYSTYSINLGNGLLGGYSETFDSHGAAAADLVLKILAGGDPASLPPHANPDKAYRVDYRALQRWELKEADLPPGTVILFKDPSIWDQHRGAALAALSTIVVLTALVAALLVQRHRRHAAELLLTESEERMTFTAASMNVGLWQFDPEAGELWATEHCRALFGVPAGAKLTRERFLAAVHPDDRVMAIDALRAVPGSNRSNGVDVRIPQPDGEIRWIRVRVRTDAADAGSSRRLNGIFIDVTDQKRAESEAEIQRQEVAHLMRVSMLGELSGAIAHEISQPLTAVQSNAEAGLMLLGTASPDLVELREVLEDIAQDNRRAGDVIQRLRSLLRKGGRKVDLIDLNELVRSTVSLLNSELISRRISLQLELAEGLPAAWGDSTQLQQVLLNLLMNAMDAVAHMPQARRLVAVSTRIERTGAIELLVRDHGEGIPTEQQDKLFQPFHTTKPHGLGLGLTICSTIVHVHGGDLTLVNAHDGGAIAAFSLPAQESLAAVR